jgi:Lon protease-like protein
MFPLPGAFLFPHQVLPLHVFEPRYLQLVEDLLDASGRLVVATILADLLAQTLRAPPQVLERVFVEPSMVERARLVLRAVSPDVH